MNNTSSDDCDWLTVHRVRLRNVRDGTGNAYPAPDGAICWRFYPEATPGEYRPVSAIWGGFAIHPTRAAAEAAFLEGERALRLVGECTESWHALAVPVRHHGVANWRGHPMKDATFHSATKDPGGPLMVITSAGFENPGPTAMSRISEFGARVAQVRADYTARPEIRRVAVFTGALVDGGDGITMSIWQDQPSMIAAAYQPGAHRSHLDVHKEKPQFDRSSFSRLRLLSSSGIWDGSDPIADLS